MPTENPGRERILGRIRSALRAPAPLRHAYGGGDIFAAIPDPLERFQRECKNNYTECLVTSDHAASATAVSEILASVSPGAIFLQDAPPLRKMAAAWSNERDIRWSGEGPVGEATRATITLAELLVAATGSVFVSAACGGRGASVIAPVHIVVATLSQLATDLTVAFDRLTASRAIERNSMLSLITGPSRTGDIEKIIVRGAHGPQRLVVVLAMQDDFRPI
jgi:L-lactate utilization protein LutC